MKQQKQVYVFLLEKEKIVGKFSTIIEFILYNFKLKKGQSSAPFYIKFRI